jgi:hypothetical protein
MAGAIILFDALIGFGLPLAFAIWQLRSVNRELERDRYKRETGELGDDDGGSAADSVLYRALTRTAPTVRRPADDAQAAADS